MKRTELKVNGAFVYDIDRYDDSRGFFQEVYSEKKGYPLRVLQTNISRSEKNVVRGLHVTNFPKLCTCVAGRLFDVVVDVRKHSSTYLQWDGVWLDENNSKQLYVPSDCAHGFFAAESGTILLYSQGGTYNPHKEWSVKWNDPLLGVEWPEADEYILSEKDQAAKGIAEHHGVEV